MFKNFTPPDLSKGDYDDFEKQFSEKLDIKVILVRGFKTPTDYLRAEAKLTFAAQDGEEAYAAAKKEFEAAENTLLGALRANIVARDSDVGHALSDNDLRSLQKLGHVTQRPGLTEREQAVLVMDPAAVATPNNDPILFSLLVNHFSNAWDPFGDGRNIAVKDVIENYDIAPEDKRRYDAVLAVRYALQNQGEFNNKDKDWYYEPFYYRFAGLPQQSPGLYASDFQMAFDTVAKKYELQRVWEPKDMGIADPDFFTKLTQMAAVQSLIYSNLDTIPFATMARILDDVNEKVTPQLIVAAQKDLRAKLQEKLDAHIGPDAEKSALRREALDDWRILFPLFREVYEADESAGAKRAYLGTVMAGLQRYFPTLTNGPVPDVTKGAAEPARKIEKPGRAPDGAPKPDSAPKSP